MTTIELLKEIHRLQLECFMHRWPLYISIAGYGGNESLCICIQSESCEVLFYGMIGEKWMSKEAIRVAYRNILQAIDRHTAMKQVI